MRQLSYGCKQPATIGMIVVVEILLGFMLLKGGFWNVSKILGFATVAVLVLLAIAVLPVRRRDGDARQSIHPATTFSLPTTTRASSLHGLATLRSQLRPRRHEGTACDWSMPCFFDCAVVLQRIEVH